MQPSPLRKSSFAAILKPFLYLYQKTRMIPSKGLLIEILKEYFKPILSLFKKTQKIVWVTTSMPIIVVEASIGIEDERIYIHEPNHGRTVIFLNKKEQKLTKQLLSPVGLSLIPLYINHPKLKHVCRILLKYPNLKITNS